ncbi:MAG: SPASM domain-containing protein, partial [Proteobacteria bacterium]|nr:SPASM domain-containing protein [Pseudomonadota bacterium]
SLDQAFALGAEPPESIHWREYCQFPWTSMTVKSDGIVASCSQDYNNDLVFGDTKTQTLKEIWNSEEYDKFRKMHVYNTPGIRCTDGGCDMRVIGKLL